MSDYKYNLNRPAHLVANAVLRDVEAQANVKFLNPQDTPVYAIVEAYAQKIDALSYEKDIAEAALEKLRKEFDEYKAYWNAHMNPPRPAEQWVIDPDEDD